MKKDIFETIKNEVKLNLEEKNSIRNFVISKVSSTPITNIYEKNLNKHSYAELSFLSIIKQKHMPLILAVIILFSGGTTSILAQNSLPGDLLYPIKINVNEKVESLVTLSAKSDAEVSLKQAERRLKEAETLSSLGKLNPKTNEQIKNNFSNEVNSLNKHLNDLEKEGDKKTASEIRDELENEISDHRDIFNLISNISTTTSKNQESEGDDDKKINSDKKDEEQGVIKNSESEKEGDVNKSNQESVRGNEGEDDTEEDDDNSSIQTVITAPPSNVPPAPNNQIFTMAQIATHNNSKDCYTTVNGSVYNVTSFINQHPGGSQAIISLCGKDGSSAFTNQHGGQSGPEQELQSFKIGTLVK